MYQVYTRQNKKGNWWCNGTIQGYDYSFESPSMFDAQHQMRNLLSKKDINPDHVKWHKPTLYPTDEVK